MLARCRNLRDTAKGAVGTEIRIELRGSVLLLPSRPQHQKPGCVLRLLSTIVCRFKEASKEKHRKPTGKNRVSDTRSLLHEVQH